MKHIKLIVLTLLLLCVEQAFSVSLTSQQEQDEKETYIVSKVSGSVNLVKGRRKTPVAVGDTLEDKSMVNLGEKSKLVILSRKNLAEYTLTEPGSNTVRTYIKKGIMSARSITYQTLEWLLDQIADGSSKRIDERRADQTRDTLIYVPDSIPFDTVPTPTPVPLP